MQPPHTPAPCNTLPLKRRTRARVVVISDDDTGKEEDPSLEASFHLASSPLEALRKVPLTNLRGLFEPLMDLTKLLTTARSVATGEQFSNALEVLLPLFERATILEPPTLPVIVDCFIKV